jgi:hypothetical protein
MYARITRMPVSPYRLEEAITLARETTLPAARQQAGFKGYLMLVDKSAGQTITITFWQEADDRDISGPDSTYYQDALSQFVPFLTGAPAVEDFEVAIQV